MHTFQFVGEVPARYVEEPPSYEQLMNLGLHAHATCNDSLDCIDPALHPYHYEYAYPNKAPTNIYRDTRPYRQSLTGFDEASDVTDYDKFASPEHYDANSVLDAFQLLRYDSPSGPYGGNVSEVSSEYTLSPDANRSMITLGNSAATVLNGYASSPMQSQLSTQTSWSTNHSFVPTLSTSQSQPLLPSPVAMKELECNFPSNMQLDPPLYEDDLAIRLDIQLPMQTPVELELSESAATWTTGTHTHTIRSSYTDDEDEEEEEGSTNDAMTPTDDGNDADFNPRRSGANHYRATSRAHSRSNTSTRSPRRAARKPMHAILDTKAHVSKPSRNSKSSWTRGKPKHRDSTSTMRGSSKDSPADAKPPKSFPCSFHMFGCPATFANKNEWKRHVGSQHLQLGFFRCDLGTCNPDHDAQLHTAEYRHKRRGSTIKQESGDREVTYNDFNRKDLFTQHCRRMHGPSRCYEDNTTRTNQRINDRVRKASAHGGIKIKATKPVVTKEDEAAFEAELEEIRQRCWHVRRKAPARTCCGFCRRVFQAESYGDDMARCEERAWEERIEHVGRHYERDGCEPHTEDIDDDLQDWGLEVGLLEYVVTRSGERKPWLVGYDITPSSDDADTEDATKIPRRKGLRQRDGRHSNDYSQYGTIEVQSAAWKVKDEDDYHSEDALAEDE